MISDIGVEAQLALESWRDATNREEIDPDADLTNLIPALSRLLGWLGEGETCERRGMRVTVLLEVGRPDFNHGKSLGQMSPTSKQNLSKLMTDFRLTFGWRQCAHPA